MFRFIKSLCKGRWTAVTGCWPYAEGYATYHRRSNTVLDTGLSKDEAKAECRKLNRYERVQTRPAQESE